jgi:hypothetical protein
MEKTNVFFPSTLMGHVLAVIYHVTRKNLRTIIIVLWSMAT